MSFLKTRTINNTMTDSPTKVAIWRVRTLTGFRLTASRAKKRRMPPIENRDGQQVEETEVDGEEHHDVEEVVPAALLGLRRELTDQNRSAELLDRDVAGQQAPHLDGDHLDAVPRVEDRPVHGVRQDVLVFDGLDDAELAEVLRPDLDDFDLVAELAFFDAHVGAERLRERLAPPLEGQDVLVVRRLVELALHVAPRRHRLAVEL